MIEVYTCPICKKWLHEDPEGMLNNCAIFICGNDYERSHFRVAFVGYDHRTEYYGNHCSVNYVNGVPEKILITRIVKEFGNGTVLAQKNIIPLNKPMTPEEVVKKVNTALLFL